MASMEVQLGPTTNNRVDSPSMATNACCHNPYDLHHHHPNHQQPPFQHQQTGYHSYGSPTPPPRRSKRKAESQENERLSKRLGLLNLEKNGPKLYVPVENTSSQSLPIHPAHNNACNDAVSQGHSSPVDDTMQLDNTKHKVYIYDLDAELSSADESSEHESRPGSPTSGHDRVIFLSDVDKHLHRPRIPPVVLANSEGKLAGHDINDMQVVLYSEPTSLTVPREHDSVRKAILEARARARQKQKDAQEQAEQETQPPSFTASGHDFEFNATTNGFSGNATPWRESLIVDQDPDAMDMD
ncbi:hypothetical protein F4803DRAFT_391324 [Xylaria telfairii]|nr:hypothetical protein F4803DRAFT_391324 [Xylaria telfairii]